MWRPVASREVRVPGWTYSDAQRRAAEAYGRALREAGHGTITTEIAEAPELYYAEAYDQQYLAKDPGGHCGHGGTGVACPLGLRVATAVSR